MNKSELIYNIDRAIENDQAAIEALYNYTYAGMYSLAYRLCRSKDAAEDILQESYIAAFSGLNTLRYKGMFWQWLKGIVINKWRDYSKSNLIFSDAVEYDSMEEQNELDPSEASIQENLENEEKKRELWRLVDKLPENQRVCMILFYYENMSIDEIAKTLDIPKGSVKSRLHYGREKLKTLLRGNNWFAGAALPGLITEAAEGEKAEMLRQILAALEKGSEGSSAVIAVKAAGSGLLLRLGIGAVSLITAAGIIGGAVIMHGDAAPRPDAIVSTASLKTETATTSTTLPTTAKTTITTTTTAAAEPAKTVTFNYRETEGGIIIEKYTGTAENVTVPDKLGGQKVVSIGANAFKYCRTLKSVSIPGSVTSIGGNAFRECTNLTSVTLRGGLSTIGDMAFLGCSSLKSVHIPASVRSIGIYAFAYCTSLKSVEISEGTETVKYCAFYDCPNLRRVVLPGTVSVIGNDAFAGAHSEFTLCVREGTYAHTYALDKGFNFEFAG